MKVLMLGGYGVFGGRLASLLADLPQLELCIAGRDARKAKAFCAAFNGRATARPLMLDRADIAAALAAHQPDLVVDASGPFQHYGEQRYRVIEACIAQKVNYLDFADAADFVFGVDRFDAAAKAAGVFVLSGVSSFPVLTAAVLHHMARSMEVVAVQGGIAPSPFAGVGLNVMRAVVGYAGEPVKLQRAGRQAHGVGLAESMRYTVAVPGRLPLRNILYSLVDVPDLQVIPPAYPGMTDIWMGAGPVPEVLHRVLNLLAKLRARFGLPSLVPLSRLFYAVLNAMKFGEHRGGMFVHAQGLRDGQPVVQSWHLLAEGDDGPYIPSMAIEALIRKRLAGNAPAPGARPGTQALELADYEPLFANRAIYTGFRSEAAGGSIFQQLLGSAFAALPPVVQQMHSDCAGMRRWAGTADIRRGTSWAAALVARVMGFPSAGKAVPVTVEVISRAGSERWTRHFGGKQFSSILSKGVGKNSYLLVERFGAISVALALLVEGDRLYLVPRRWSCLGIPLPQCLLPAGRSFESSQNGAFLFDIEIAAPLLGLIVAYQGLLRQQPD